MPAIVFSGPNSVTVAEVDRPRVAPRQVLARVSVVGLCGTDRHLLTGESAYIKMGLTYFPVRFGHEWSGTVVAVGEEVDESWVGKRVTGGPFVSCGQCRVCRGGRYNLCPQRSELGVRGSAPGAAAEYFAVPVDNLSQVPDSVSLEEAVLAEPAVTILNALELTNLQPGDRVGVLGTGTMGLLAIQVAKAMDCSVDVVGVEESGMELAETMGADTVLFPGEAPSDAYDVLIEATGSSTIGPLLGRLPAVGGRIAQVGIPGEALTGFAAADFVAKGLTLVGVLGGVHLLERALRLIVAQAIRPAELIDRIVPATDIATAFRLMREPRQKPKILVDMAPLWAESTGRRVHEEGSYR